MVRQGEQETRVDRKTGQAGDRESREHEGKEKLKKRDEARSSQKGKQRSNANEFKRSETGN